ncbi:MAG: hypothetical protein JNL82_08865 [Myxococcales bacterium]|nr:hypothetical protein [Myxococcales bacterium]
MRPDPSLTRSYYLTALTALRFLDARTNGRRFGKDADARWKSFAGDDPEDRAPGRLRILTDLDRIDLLLRDADAQWPGAFGARTVFDLPEVAEDDSFGAEWDPEVQPSGEAERRPSIDGTALWKQVMGAPAPADIPELLRCLAAIWEIPLSTHPLSPPRPGTRWLLRGAGATASAIQAFATSPDAVWHTQVLVVAEPPLADDAGPRQQRQRSFARQLAALAAALLDQPARTRLLRAAPPPSEHPNYERITSGDAEP